MVLWTQAKKMVTNGGTSLVRRHCLSQNRNFDGTMSAYLKLHLAERITSALSLLFDIRSSILVKIIHFSFHDYFSPGQDVADRASYKACNALRINVVKNRGTERK